MLNHISCEESKLLREKNERMLNVGSCLEFKTLSPAWKRSPLPASWGLRVTELLLVVARESPDPCLNMQG